MAKRRIVVALGGNAILSKDASAEAQQQALRDTAKYLVQFIKQGDDLIVSHGNGPQVGNLLLQQAAGSTDKNPAMPLDTAVAMTQGSIGYWMQNALGEEITKAGLDKDVTTMVTQVEVDPDDQAFTNPSKPIGPFYTEAEIKDIKAAHPEYTYVEDAGRGYRRVVPSPRPTGVKEYKVVNALVDAGIVPISVGGGGVPVVQEGDRLVGREAVIDKDFASEKLAELVHADLLIILTAVNNIYINFNKPDQKKLETVSVAELQEYIDQDQFAKGSMLPKVQAAINFVNNSEGGKAVVTSLENVGNFLKNGDGTIITK
ncbi:carbamate kinase [Levilactobacillus brevis]|uniref:Carbamate kinase n=1 Tax=Levilactobacillus brevis ATCC 14869 = DSM 20054 TaxID=649758 RepID=U2R5R1_LEVBR|nr:carbamate kinase [Levilactobacillus brevis]ERK46002.1 carbamate kinase [Levilactobacillus brevis ATCC 14869 = DSM 20054]KIO99154.1 Carbamate kinase [Levilactobacillus brevis]KRK21321.1 carbamate kinase [Levilactobacillus brevis ATCC 14869 = DSM 20054]MCT3571830.1 carbamate kinase [Levilactobacillus brevis]SQG81850.1 Carbamate kinase [Levilactobacillus brevis]